jgi:MFS superfamily sulfate permease-like transporter
LSTILIGARPRRWPLIVVGTIVLLGIVFTALSGFVIDLLWFGEIDQRGVFLTTLWTKVILALTFGVLFAVLLYVNLLIARRLRPTTRALTPDQPRASARGSRPFPRSGTQCRAAGSRPCRAARPRPGACRRSR